MAKRRKSMSSSCLGAAALAIFVVAFTLRMIHIWQIRQAPFFAVLMGDARGYDEWDLWSSRFRENPRSGPRR